MSRPTTPGPLPDNDFSDMTNGMADTLLKRALVGMVPPIEELVAHLRAHGGAESLGKLVCAGLDATIPDAANRLITDVVSPGELAAAKAKAKSKAAGAEQRLPWTFAYFASLAGALVHHRTLMSSQSPERLSAALKALAAAAPPPWSEFFSEACKELAGIAADGYPAGPSHDVMRRNCRPDKD
jgi:hypothetical protein